MDTQAYFEAILIMVTSIFQGDSANSNQQSCELSFEKIKLFIFAETGIFLIKILKHYYF